MSYYVPTVHNLLALWRWATGQADPRTVPMSRYEAYTQAEALDFLRRKSQARILCGAPITGDPALHPAPAWRKLDPDYQLGLERDARAARHEGPFLNPWRRFQTPELHARLGA